MKYILNKYLILSSVIIFISCETIENKNNKRENKDSAEIILKNYPISKEEDNFVSARYPEGEIELKKFIKKNLWEGQDPPKNIIQGKVTVFFTVLSDGSLKDFKIVETIDGCEICEKESLRIAKRMPKWYPAYEKIDNNGGRKNYESSQVIEIEFK